MLRQSEILDLTAETVPFTVDLAAPSTEPTMRTGEVTPIDLTDILHILGGDGDDIFTGDGMGNSLHGGDGADTLAGGAGPDTLNGGGGDADWVSYAGSIAGVAVELGLAGAQAGADNDVLENIEAAIGSALNDTLEGDGNANTLLGGEGNNDLTGGGGDDSLSGGGGDDTYRFAPGDGADTVSDAGGTDTVFFASLTGNSAYNFLYFARGSGGDVDDLIITNLQTGGGTIRFNDFFSGTTLGTGAIETFEAARAIMTDPSASFAVAYTRIDNLINAMPATIPTTGNKLPDSTLQNVNFQLAWGLPVLIDPALDLRGVTGPVTLNLADGSRSGADTEISALLMLPDRDLAADITNVFGTDEDDHFTGDSDANTLRGEGGADTLLGGGEADRLEGGSGEDLASYDGAGAGVTIDLGAGTGVGDEATGDILIDIEHVQGGGFNDALTGDMRGNSLLGGGGDDLLTGGSGDDTLLGGMDNDEYVFVPGDGSDRIEDSGGSADIARFTGVNAHSSLHFARPAGSDDLVVTNLQATGGTITITGFFANTGLGMGAIEIFEAGGQQFSVTRDKIDALINIMPATIPTTGTALPDSVTQSSDFIAAWGLPSLPSELDLSVETQGFTINLDLGTASPPTDQDGMRINLPGIAHIRGGRVADHFTGNDQGNSLFGGGGDDTLKGGAGADSLNGGAGNDLASFAGANAAVTVNLQAGTGLGGDAAGDILADIEALVGSSFDDVLIGDDGANTLAGGDGADKLDGGAGEDLASYAGERPNVTVNLGVTTAQTGAGGDILANIEHVAGGVGTDALTGNDQGNSLFGGDNNDTLTGGGGMDTLKGGMGDDALQGGHDDDTYLFVPGEGDNRIDDAGGDADIVGFDGPNAYNFLHFARSASGTDLIVTNLDGVGSTVTIADFFAAAALGTGAIETFTAGGQQFSVDYDAITNLIGVMPATRPAFGAPLPASVTETTEFTTAWGLPNLSVILNLVGVAGAVTVDLDLGISSGSNISTELDGRNLGTNIRHVIGTRFDDSLTGNGQDNSLIGGVGNDTLAGGNGADSLDGEGGSDLASYAGTSTDVTVDLGVTTAQMGAGADILANIEHVQGGTGADVLTGDGGGNSLLGGDGEDLLDGGAGDDTLLGGADNDRYVFSPGDGDDWIMDTGNSFDSARFSGMEAHLYLHFARAGGDPDDLVITDLKASGATVTIEDFFAGTALGNGAIEQIEAGGRTFTIDAGKIIALVAAMGAVPAPGTELDDSITTTGAFTTAWGLPAFGVDTTLDLSDIDDSVTVDLVDTGAPITGPGSADAVTELAPRTLGVDIVHVIGTDKADILTGDAGGNSLVGGDGSDTLVGGAGPDSLVGGDGDDVVSYAGSGDGVTINLATNMGSGGDAAGDFLDDIETVIGSGGDDDLTGGSDANLLEGGVGNDTLAGNQGNDTLAGGMDDDRYVFAPGGGTDRILDRDGDNIAAFSGTNAHNFLHFARATGSADLVVTNLQTGGGSITIADFFAGPALGTGALQSFEAGGRTFEIDYDKVTDLIGIMPMTAPGAGTGLPDSVTTTDIFFDAWNIPRPSDILDLAAVAGSVTVNLDTGASITGGGATDAGTELAGRNLRVDIRHVIGTTANDVLTGDNRANSLLGGAGNDTLEGGEGADTLDGGSGVDLVSYEGSSVGVTVGLTVQTSLPLLAGGDAVGDVLRNIEHIQGSDGNDSLAGNSLANSLLGGMGDDTLEGLGGNDTLVGGMGDDTYLYDGMGLDHIDDSGGDEDRLVISNLTIEQLWVRRDGADLTFQVVGGTANKLVIADYFSSATGTGAGTGYIEMVQAGGGSLSSEISDIIALTELPEPGGFDPDRSDSLLAATTTTDAWIDAWSLRTLDLGERNVGTEIDLLAHTADPVLDPELDLDLARLPTISHVLGGMGDDYLLGDGGNNSLLGRDGADTLDGRAGDDSLEGGAGDDVYIFAGLGIDRIEDSGGEDELRIQGIERRRLWFEREGDDLIIRQLGSTDRVQVVDHFATSGDNRIERFLVAGQGFTADDVVRLARIMDQYEADNTSFDPEDTGQRIPPGIEQDPEYRRIWSLPPLADPPTPAPPPAPTPDATSPDGVVADLETRVTTEGTITPMTRDYTGGPGNDLVSGNDDGNRLRGGEGNDIIEGRGGDDTLAGGTAFDILDGGDGEDFVDYSEDGQGIRLHLGQSLGYLGSADGDIFIDIEGAIGSSLGDTLIGSDMADSLAGGRGLDSLVGGAGDDIYLIGANTDQERILDTGGSDAILFGQDLQDSGPVPSIDLHERLWFESTGSDLLVRILGSDDTVRIENFNMADGRIERLETPDYVAADLTEFNNLIDAMAGLRMAGVDPDDLNSIRDIDNLPMRNTAMMAVNAAWTAS